MLNWNKMDISKSVSDLKQDINLIIPISSFMDLNSSLKPYENLNKTKAINCLLYGSQKMLNKVCKEGRYIHRSHFFLIEEPSGYILQWISRKKVYQSSRIVLDKSIHILDHDHKLRKQYLSKLEEKKRHLTLKYGNKNKTLVLEFDNEDERDHFRFGLEYFIHRSKILRDLFEMEKGFKINFDANLSAITADVSPLKPQTSLLSNSFSKPYKEKEQSNNSFSKNNKEKDFSNSFTKPGKEKDFFNSTGKHNKELSNSKNKSLVIPNYFISDIKQLKEICNSLCLNIEIDYLNSQYIFFLQKKGITEIYFENFKDLLIHLFARKEVIPLYITYAEEEEKEINFNAPYMTNEQLQFFFKSVQSQTIKIDDINEIIKRSFWNWSNLIISSSVLKEPHDSLSFMSFCRILFSENNSIFSHEKSLVYQNMDRPLSDYYINGLTRCFSQEPSTYLKKNNLESFLNKALDKGSRHLEFLLTNLEDDNLEPILVLPESSQEEISSSAMLCHNPIFFKEILKLLKKNAFLNNRFPLFLSLRIAKDSSLSEEALQKLIQDIIGLESLFILPIDHKIQTLLPSPKSLERKFILILAGNMPDLKSPSDYLVPLLNTTEMSDGVASDCNAEGSEEGILDENPAKMISAMPIYSNKNNKTNFRVMNSNNLIMRLDDAGSEEDEEEEKRASVFKHSYEGNLLLYLEHLKDMIKDDSGRNNHLPEGLDHGKRKQNIAPFHQKIKSPELPQKLPIGINPKNTEKNLKSKTKIKAIKFNGLLALGGFFEAKIPLDKPDEDIYKVNTIVMKELHKGSLNKWVEFHRKHLSLVYNLILDEEKALLFYQTGAQINNLQPQNNPQDLSVLVNFSKFQENGGNNSGYLLKPAAFLHDYKNDTEQILNVNNGEDEYKKVVEEPSVLLKPKVLVHMTILSASQLKCPSIKKVVSPFIEIGMRGMDIDEQSNKIYRTNTVENNGFNPIFDDKITCEFFIRKPEFAVIYVQVWDESEEMSESHFLGWYGVPVTCIRSGFRVIPLRDWDLAVIEKSSLFCKVEVKNLLE